MVQRKINYDFTEDFINSRDEMVFFYMMERKS